MPTLFTRGTENWYGAAPEVLAGTRLPDYIGAAKTGYEVGTGMGALPFNAYAAGVERQRQIQAARLAQGINQQLAQEIADIKAGKWEMQNPDGSKRPMTAAEQQQAVEWRQLRISQNAQGVSVGSPLEVYRQALEAQQVQQGVTLQQAQNKGVLPQGTSAAVPVPKGTIPNKPTTPTSPIPNKPAPEKVDPEVQKHREKGAGSQDLSYESGTSTDLGYASYNTGAYPSPATFLQSSSPGYWDQLSSGLPAPQLVSAQVASPQLGLMPAPIDYQYV